jgi:hypothetical protein
MAEWTMEEVAARFTEAAETGRRLPPVRVQGYFNSWSMLAFHVPDRYPDPQRICRPMPPSPAAIDQMLEVMRWVQWLDPESRHIVWMRADRCEWPQIARRFGCAVRTAQRRRDRALLIVTEHLNGVRVVVAS